MCRSTMPFSAASSPHKQRTTSQRPPSTFPTTGQRSAAPESSIRKGLWCVPGIDARGADPWSSRVLVGLLCACREHLCMLIERTDKEWTLCTLNLSFANPPAGESILCPVLRAIHVPDGRAWQAHRPGLCREPGPTWSPFCLGCSPAARPRPSFLLPLLQLASPVQPLSHSSLSLNLPSFSFFLSVCRSVCLPACPCLAPVSTFSLVASLSLCFISLSLSFLFSCLSLSLLSLCLSVPFCHSPSVSVSVSLFVSPLSLSLSLSSLCPLSVSPCLSVCLCLAASGLPPCVCVSLSVSLSLFLSLSVPLLLSVALPFCLFVLCPYVSRSLCPCVCLAFCLYVSLSLSVRLSISLSSFVSFCLSCLFRLLSPPSCRRPPLYLFRLGPFLSCRSSPPLSVPIGSAAFAFLAAFLTLYVLQCSGSSGTALFDLLFLCFSGWRQRETDNKSCRRRVRKRWSRSAWIASRRRQCQGRNCRLEGNSWEKSRPGKKGIGALTCQGGSRAWRDWDAPLTKKSEGANET